MIVKTVLNAPWSEFTPILFTQLVVQGLRFALDSGMGIFEYGKHMLNNGWYEAGAIFLVGACLLVSVYGYVNLLTENSLDVMYYITLSLNAVAALALSLSVHQWKSEHVTETIYAEGGE